MEVWKEMAEDPENGHGGLRLFASSWVMRWTNPKTAERQSVKDEGSKGCSGQYQEPSFVDLSKDFQEFIKYKNLIVISGISRREFADSVVENATSFFRSPDCYHRYHHL